MRTYIHRQGFSTPKSKVSTRAISCCGGFSDASRGDTVIVTGFEDLGPGELLGCSSSWGAWIAWENWGCSTFIPPSREDLVKRIDNV